jgi:hypothetical protein
MKPLSPLVESYIQATNNHDAAAFLGLFADNAFVDDNGRAFHGRDAIMEWSDREIFSAQVTLDVIDFDVRDSEAVVTTKVDGNLDRTGLPDPVIIDQYFTVEGGKIVGLTCRLAGERETR